MRIRTLRLPCLAASFLIAAVAPAAAGEPSAEDIVRFLSPKPTKSLVVTERIADPVRGREAESLAAIRRADPPSINLRLAFDYDSDRLTAETRRSLDTVAAALGDDRLLPYHFIIAGHTDAKGGEAYNDALSNRRAGAVRDYIVGAGVDPGRLVAIGYGERDLADARNPEDGVNRRVQIINQL